MSMPDMETQGPFHMDPAVVVWTLVRELLEQQRSLVQLEQTLDAVKAQHANNYDEVVSLTYDLKNLSDLVALRRLWYSKGLPSMLAKLSVALEAHETFGDQELSIDDPVDAELWRSKYFVAVNDLSVTPPRNPPRISEA
ncbi:hypothetical protein A5739_04750 [Mycobacterium colombiense]|uniref:hypothetical protein n=2 Tax=Mycobacterium colombiense TaxID=339268 RepID=UPI00096D49F4|nr:hypothetical protein [Mycobacterium colombiense]OMB99082.1 hypothetical protein A5732_03660 [Mycobacterium colombiense]OMC36172.1 hypothetical protein A5739_04750 [Mycobacterium colombiense]